MSTMCNNPQGSSCLQNHPLCNSRPVSSLLPIRPNPVRQSSWRSLAVGENFSNRRRELIHAGARHDDAVATAMSFFRDTQEPTALVFPELDVEVLTLDLQFFRLDDVIHFALRAPSLG